MWKTCLALIFGFVCQSCAEALDYTPFERVLAEVVDKEGRVDYRMLKHNADLQAFVKQIATVNPEMHPQFFRSSSDSLAFWINAYNAFVLFGVAEVYPIKSVREIAPDFAFFKKRTFRVGNRHLTLDHIEHKIIRKQFQDPRTHAAINCAAVSCPRLQPVVFKPSILDAQLQVAIQDMVQNKTVMVKAVES